MLILVVVQEDLETCLEKSSYFNIPSCVYDTMGKFILTALAHFPPRYGDTVCVTHRI